MRIAILSLLALSVLFPATARTQATGTLAGAVTSEDGRPIDGASVTVSGTQLRAVTAATGRYTITGVPVGPQSVVARRIGFAYVTKIVTVSANQVTSTVFQLKEQAVSLDQIVSIGYTAASVKDLTGAVSVLSGDEVQATGVPLITLSVALQGKLAGLDVVSNSGLPGAGARVRVRGSGSINANAEPLYVVDGVPLLQGSGSDVPTVNPLASIDPNEITSIQLLKDAASTAIYGSRGSNGVFLIETRHGQRGESGVEVETSYGSQTISKRISVLDGPDFMRLVNEAQVNAGFTARYTLAQIAAAPTYDYEAMLLHSAPQMTQQITFHGGDKQLRYLVSGNYTKQDGIELNSDFSRFGLRLNVDDDFSRRLRIGTSISLTRSESNAPSEDRGAIGNSTNGVSSAMIYNPTTPPRDTITGQWIKSSPETSLQVSNPLANVSEQILRNTNMQLFGTMYAELDLSSEARLRSTFSGNFGFASTDWFAPRTILAGSPAGLGSLSTSQSRDLTSTTTIDLLRTLGPRSLDLVGGFEVQTSENESLTGNENGLPTDATTVFALGSSVTPVRASSSQTASALLSFFTRANYGIADRYLFSVSARRDGSSKFGANNKWAFFPSAAFAWRISNEAFMQRQRIFSDLKLRLSTGVAGNQAINPYQTLSQLTSGFANFGGSEIATVTPSSTEPNPNLKWEKTTDRNVGVDAGFLDGRLTITLDAYQRTTNDLLFDVGVPQTTGFGDQLQNVGSVSNRGLELSIKTVNVSRHAFVWRSVLTASMNRSEVTDIGAGSEACRRDVNACPTIRGRGIQFAGDTHILQVGQPLGAIFGYRVLGLWQPGDTCNLRVATACTPGEYKIQDTNGDGAITTADRVILGTGEPKVYGGFGNSLVYGSFSLDVFFTFAGGNKLINGSLYYGCEGLMQGNERSCMLDRWTPTNMSTDVPRPNASRSRLVYSSVVEDGSYVRLQTVALGYELPARLVPRAHSIRIYLSAENLWLRTRYSGFDPEASSAGSNNTTPGVDAGAYPRAKSWNLGARVAY